MRNATHILISGFALLFCLQCSDKQPNEPGALVRTDSASSVFAWEVDSLSLVRFEGRRLYGTSATNVFVSGSFLMPYPNSSAPCMKWDGVSWMQQDISLSSVGNEVWMIDGIGDKFFVIGGISYIGNDALAVIEYGTIRYIDVPTSFRYRTAMDVVSPFEIYVAGRDGIIRYNGTSWKWMLADRDFTNQSMASIFNPVHIKFLGRGEIEVVSKFRMPEGLNVVERWRYRDGTLELVDSFNDSTPVEDIRFGTHVTNNPSGDLTVSRGGVFIRDGEGWRRIHQQPGSRVTGSIHNLFVSMSSEIYHFNGSTWNEISSQLRVSNPGPKIIFDILYVENVLFVIGLNQEFKSCIYRGRQQ